MTQRIVIAIATVGRAEITRRTVDRLVEQTRLPDGILVVGASPADVVGVDEARSRPTVILAATKGLCAQRNAALAELRDRADIIIFLDDDYVAAADFVEQADRIFATRPQVVGATGWLIADGIHGAGYSVEEALALIEADVPGPPQELPREALYGCNMILRTAALGGLRFDEALPFYGWQEDIDFTYQLGRRGELIKSSLIRGVHMGAKSGRSPGKRVGYSQIANPIYLLRKKTIPPHLAWRLMRQNLIANLVRSLKPEPAIDRRGRALGNLQAIWETITGRMDPRRILDIH